jgi:hypothetical protein
MREKRLRTKFTLGRFESGTDVVDHELEAEPEAYGAAAYLIVVHLVRMLAGRDARSRRDVAALLEIAAKDADKLKDTFGKETALLIRRVLTMKPLSDPRPRH